MTRERYNETLGKKQKPEIENRLCSWDFCNVCINLRIRKKMPLPELKKGIYPTYHRYLEPSLKPTGYVKKSLKVGTLQS